jgi:hypothetical protein
MNRNQAVDFLRGLGLWMLFLNHLRPNVWSHLTNAQFGFSDFAEIFVFLSGYVGASMYERALQSGGMSAALGKFRSRFIKIYIAHIGSLVAGLGIMGAFAARGLYLWDSNSSFYLWMGEPMRYLGRALLLLYSPAMFSLLPLYLVLSPLAVMAVVALRRWPSWVLASSFAVWCVAQTGRFDFPLMRETWFFQPFAWQFLLVLGAASRMYWGKVKRIAESRILQGLAIVVVVIAFFLKTARLFGIIRGYDEFLIYNAGKPHLAPTRLVHFLSLVILIVGIRWGWQKWIETRAGRLTVAAGRDSLFIYSVSLVLAVLLDLLLKGLNGGALLQLACCALGLFILCRLADRRNKVQSRVVLQPEQSGE